MKNILLSISMKLYNEIEKIANDETSEFSATANRIIKNSIRVWYDESGNISMNKWGNLDSNITCVKVKWNDPENLYKQTIEIVKNQKGIDKFGLKEKYITSHGCTTKAQAIRFGEKYLKTYHDDDRKDDYITYIKELNIGAQLKK